MVLSWKMVYGSLQVGSEKSSQVEEFNYLGVLFMSVDITESYLREQRCGTDACRDAVPVCRHQEGAEENGQTGSRWQKGNRNPNDHLLQPRYVEYQLQSHITLNLEGDGLQQQTTQGATPVRQQLETEDTMEPAWVRQKRCYFYQLCGSNSRNALHLGLFGRNDQGKESNKPKQAIQIINFMSFYGYKEPCCTTAMLQSAHHTAPNERSYTSIPPWLMWRG